MQGHDSWSLSVGQWLRVPVRLHCGLLLFVILVFAVEAHFVHLPAAMGGLPNGTALATILALCGALAIHEFAHIFAAVSLGGSVRKVVLTPWGGMTDYSLSNSAREQFIVHAAGPFANAMVFLLLGGMLAQLGHGSFGQLMNPLRPHAMAGITEVAALKIFSWVNFQLALVNFLPAYPFDGCQLLRIFIWGNNKLIPRLRLETSVMAVAYMVAVALVVLAWFAKDYKDCPIQPVWAVLGTFGVLMMFASRVEYYRQTAAVLSPGRSRSRDEEMIDFEPVYDEDTDDFDFDHDPDESISEWLRQKQEERHLVEIEIEKEDELQADNILAKLYRSGPGSLSEEERTVLERVSDRYRRRRSRQLPS
jgi:Zn-dependent protease